MLEIDESRTILMADDDVEDTLLVREAMKECRLQEDLRCVHDGNDLMEYLHCTGKYQNHADAPRPALILLDLNMPRKNGRESLHEIKCDPALRQIPIVVFTSSMAPDDVRRAYELGANSYIAKPASFDRLVDVVDTVVKYWLQIVVLP